MKYDFSKSIMSSHMNLVILFLLPLLTAASITDLNSGHIPNYIICIGVLVGIPFFDRFFFVRFITVIILGILIHRFGLFGAGDIKLSGLIIAYMGYKSGGYCLLISLVLAAVISLVILIKRHLMVERMRLLLEYMTNVMQGRISSYRTGKRAERFAQIPMAPMLLCGTSVYLMLSCI